MKKVLLSAGILGLFAIALVSCGDKSDCDCTVFPKDGATEATTTTLDTWTDFDGDCSEITASDIESHYSAWNDLEGNGLTFSCKEH